MAYKSLLTIATTKDQSAAILETAIAISRAEGGHLDVQCIGVDRSQNGYYYAAANALIQQDNIQRAHTESEEIEAASRERLTRSDINWACEACVATLAGLARVVALRARFADLVILPKPYGDGAGHELEVVVEAALFEARSPVLVVPADSEATLTPKRVVVAWNESSEALAAVRAALPVLQAADVVNIAIIDPPRHGLDRSDPGGALSQMLARHGVRAEISVLAKTLPRVSDVLMRHVQDLDADMMVMGAYGHSRFSEAILGGATRNMLEYAVVPVLLTH